MLQDVNTEEELDVDKVSKENFGLLLLTNKQLRSINYDSQTLYLQYDPILSNF